jgi:hypothetical protein
MRQRGRPKKTWKRSVLEGAQRGGRTWREVKRLAADRGHWKSFVEAHLKVEKLYHEQATLGKKCPVCSTAASIW